MKRTPLFPALRAKALEEIERIAATTLGGADKRERVVDAVVAWVDQRTSYPNTPAGIIAEMMDGPVIRLLVGALVQEVYEATRGDRP